MIRYYKASEIRAICVEIYGNTKILENPTVYADSAKHFVGFLSVEENRGRTFSRPEDCFGIRCGECCLSLQVSNKRDFHCAIKDHADKMELLLQTVSLLCRMSPGNNPFSKQYTGDDIVFTFSLVGDASKSKEANKIGWEGVGATDEVSFGDRQSIRAQRLKNLLGQGA